MPVLWRNTKFWMTVWSRRGSNRSPSVHYILFSRPRRFGKSLNMSMLKGFFETGSDPALFEGLKIMREKDLCEKYMGKFPVISISLKGVGGLNYKDKWPYTWYTTYHKRGGDAYEIWFQGFNVFWNVSHCISASNEPGGHTCMHIWRLPRESNSGGIWPLTLILQICQ